MKAFTTNLLKKRKTLRRRKKQNENSNPVQSLIELKFLGNEVQKTTSSRFRIEQVGCRVWTPSLILTCQTK